MKQELIKILGLVSSREITDDEILEHVSRLRFELHAKQGYASKTLIEKLKADGYFKFDVARQAWRCELSDMEMRRITNQ